jgi:hypothetical protein
MEITIAEQGLFLLPIKVTSEQAKEKAWEHKLTVFGTLSKFLMRPKPEEIQVAVLELRHEPFWHAAAHKRFRYDHRTQYQVPVSRDVRGVDIAGQAYAPSSGHLTLTAMEHCLFEEQKVIFLDGVTGEVEDMQRYLAFDRVAAVEGRTFPADVALVPPEVRASAVVRQVLGDVMHPPNADEILEEEVMVDVLDLYYRPVYALEYVWQAKGKRVTVEVDGLTGEFKPTGKAFGDQLKKVLQRDVLFAVGGDVLNFVVPGGSIAVKLTKAVLDSRQAKRP